MPVQRVRSGERVNAPVGPRTGEKAKTPLHLQVCRRGRGFGYPTSLFASLSAFPSSRRFAGHNGPNPRYSGISNCNALAIVRSCYHRLMTLFARDATRRLFLATVCAAVPAFAQEKKGESFPAASRHYPDPTTDLDVIRLTDPAYSSTLPAYYNRAIARNSGSLLFCCDRAGSPQAFRIDLKTAQQRQLTDAADLDASSLSLTPDNRSFCYFAGRSLYISSLSTLHERELYQVPEGWERCAGLSVGPDGTHATFAEKKGVGSRLRMVPLAQGAPHTVVESPFAMSDPLPRPMRAQILYRQGDEALWLVNLDGQQNRKVKIAAGRNVGANWTMDGKTLLYLNLPDDKQQLNAIRELAPDTNTDKLVAKTSQFASFGFNRDSSVFVGASANVSSPTVLIMLRLTRRELTLCEHKASQPAMCAPQFSPDSQRIYFQSDRDGKPAIYCMHVEKLVEKTEVDTKL
jgi:oligogalacturonide lyase